MKILAYTVSYASETITFIVNELKDVELHHDLQLVYSNRLNPNNGAIKKMVEIPYKFNKVDNKFRWWLEQSQLYYTLHNRNFKVKLNKLIDEFKPDLIHCHFGTDFLIFFANLKPKHKDIPILVSIYGYDATERLKNMAVRKTYQKFMNRNNIYSIAVSKNLVNYMNEMVKPTNSCKLLHSGIDTDFFKRKEIEMIKEEFVFLQVSSFNERKGHKHFLNAFSKFIHEDKRYNYKFLIIGFGPLELEIKEQIKELHLENSVEVRGPISPYEMVNIASGVNCFVHMSIVTQNGEEEGLPNVLLEAMSLELPILSTWHAGIPEIVEHNVNGILCEEKNVEEYLSALKTIVGWKKKPENRKKIVDQFSFKSHMKQIYNLYDSMVQN